MNIIRTALIAPVLALALLLGAGTAGASFVELDQGLVLQSAGETLDFTFSILEEHAGYESEFGYFDINEPTVYNPIFTYGDEPSDSVSMNFGAGTYGFYFDVRNEDILVGTYGDIRDSDHLMWEVADNTAYFYLDDSDRYPDRDFNDMVVEGNAPAVPIPGAVWLLGSGLLGLIGFRNRRRS